MFVSAINKFLIGENKGSAGAVCGKDGGVWSSSKTLILNRNDVFFARKIFAKVDKEIKKQFTKELMKFQFMLSGVTFYVTSYFSDDYNTEIQAKAVGYESGCSMVLIDSGFVIGYYDSPITPEENIIATRQLAAHVSELGY
ncbi:Profilin [Entamoeba marina]